MSKNGSFAGMLDMGKCTKKSMPTPAMKRLIWRTNCGVKRPSNADYSVVGEATDELRDDYL